MPEGLACAKQFRSWLGTCQKNGIPGWQSSIRGYPPVLKTTLLVGVLDPISYDADCCSDAFDVFVTKPLNKSTISALIFPAKNLLSKTSKSQHYINEKYDDDHEYNDNSGEDDMDSDFKQSYPRRRRKNKNGRFELFSCFADSCQCSPYSDE